mgnify:CR=1 FL=1
MSAATLITLALLLLVAAAMSAYWIAVNVELWWCIRKLPTARDGTALADARDPAKPWPTLCLIIPAHNEARSIATVARSLIAQDYPHLRVVFVLDRCTDDTESVLRGLLADDPRFTILLNDSCPPDWAGKVNAVYSAVERTESARTADLLAFADADTELDPRCLRACVALLEHRNLDLLSLMSTLSCERWFERLIQPAAGYELLRQFPPRRVNRDVSPRPIANGQFMLFRASSYRAIGGHKAVHTELLEDIALAKLIARTGHRGGFLLASGMLVCHMYDSFRGFVDGWKRIYAEMAHRRPRRLRKYALQLLLTETLLPAGAIAAGILGTTHAITHFSANTEAPLWHGILATVCGITGIAGVIAWLSALIRGSLWARTPIWVGLLQPFGAPVVVRILWSAARDLEARVPIRWAGKAYVREPRYEGDRTLRDLILGPRG